MNPERWPVLEALVQAALDRAPEQRAAYLAAHCDDRRLLAQARALVSADERAGTFLEHPAVVAMAMPATVGPYRVLHGLGRGGMGEVYLAAREDNEFQRQVAVKVLAPAIYDPEAVRRFRSERQILADLHHPNIAHLYGGGTLDDGRPYLVMEYIDGVPLHRYCEGRRSLSERLRLFLVVCEAVDHAHRNLVLHLDLKPHNVLVTRDGVPKLLDFGIATLLAGGASTLRGTPRPLTPMYASPEQLRADRLTTASDVYSLGIMLYRLLSGYLPRRCAAASVVESGSTEPEPPSAIDPATRPAPDWPAEHGPTYARLRRQLAGDLDAIILRAVRRDPQRRYPTVTALAEDVQRFLQARPVHARRATLGYRLRRLARRRRGALVATGAALVVLGGLATVTLGERERAARQRERAQHERAVARRVSALLVERAVRTPAPRALETSTMPRRVDRRDQDEPERQLKSK